MFDGEAWAPSAVGEPKAIPNQELKVRRAGAAAENGPGREEVPDDGEKQPSPTPLPELLPVPPPPPKLDALVTPAAFQENVSAEDSHPAAGDAASAPEQPAAAGREKTPLSPQNRPSKIPLPPSGKTGDNSGKTASGLPSMISVAGSTGLVLGIFLLLVWIVRRKTPQAMARLPGEAFEILGRAPLNGRQQVQLLRCGSRLLLVSVAPSGADTLTEITDPAEVDRLSGLCRQTQPGSSSAAFKQIFEQLAPRRPGRNEPLPANDSYESATAGHYRSGRGWEDRHV